MCFSILTCIPLHLSPSVYPTPSVPLCMLFLLYISSRVSQFTWFFLCVSYSAYVSRCVYPTSVNPTPCIPLRVLHSVSVLLCVRLTLCVSYSMNMSFRVHLIFQSVYASPSVFVPLHSCLTLCIFHYTWFHLYLPDKHKVGHTRCDTQKVKSKIKMKWNTHTELKARYTRSGIHTELDTQNGTHTEWKTYGIGLTRNDTYTGSDLHGMSHKRSETYTPSGYTQTVGHTRN